MNALLEARDLALHAGGRELASRLAFAVRRGEMWAVIGANGVGKTLFLRTLAGLRPIERGEVYLDGRPLSAWAAIDAARYRAYLPQALHDAFSASVLDVVVAGRHPHMSRWGWEGPEERLLAEAALAAVAVDALAARDVLTLSGGERQRVAIAAALVQDAPLLLLDEPVSHLDLHHQVAVLRHLAGLAAAGRHGIVLTLHDLNLAARFATHAMLWRGQGAVDIGPADQVLNEAALTEAFRHPVARREVAGRAVFVPD